MARFEHPHHRAVLRLLHGLDHELFDQVGALFGGGTCIVLQHGEYRWSKDVDFICNPGAGYRLLRERLAEQGGTGLFSNLDGLELSREPLADQYGIRLPVGVIGFDLPIKFEIITEARIQLESGILPDWSPVRCLSAVDQVAEKLLANADRWADRSVESRDLIDLCMLVQEHDLPAEAIAKAEAAYPVIKPLEKAVHRFQTEIDYRRRCLNSLEVKMPGRIIDGLDQLARRFGYSSTARTQQEAGPEDLVHLMNREQHGQHE